MTNEEKNFINKIRADKSKNIPVFDNNLLSNIHEKVLNRLKGIQPNQKNTGAMGSSSVNKKAENVIQADIKLRKAVKELIDSLSELNDKEVAKNLLGEHIIMLNDIFKMFE
ncbi:MAG: hypothetical protein JXB50_03535 [Spirochaetes bacterium]|nr:hypothetical protein [Spirochaetota bacterium]